MVDWLINLMWHVVPPVGLTFVAILYLPKLHRWAFNVYLGNYFDRKTLFQEHKAEYEKKMVKLMKQEANAKQEIRDQERVIEQTKMDIEEIWEREFILLKEHPLFTKINQAIQVIYNNNGRTEDWHDKRMIDSNVLAFLHSKNLVNIKSDSNNNEIIEFTDKGRFFVSKYLENDNKI